MNIQEVCKKLKENGRSIGKLCDRTIQCLDNEILNSITGIRYAPRIEELTSDDWEIEVEFEKYSFPIWLYVDRPKSIGGQRSPLLEYCFNTRTWNSEESDGCPNKFKVTVEKWSDENENDQ